MTEQEIRAGLAVDPFRIHVGRYQDEWAVRWDTAETQAALASFRENEAGIEWLRFYVAEPFRGRGIYTTALEWSVGLAVPVTAMDTVEPNLWAGFKPVDGGGLKLDKRSANGRIKKVRK